MSTSVSWPVIGGTTYSVPAAGEVNWATLSDYLVALAGAQSVVSQKVATRTAVTTPVTVAAATDCIVITNLTVPGAVAVNLPAGVDGQWFSIVDGKGDAATNNITITPNGAETINGAATYVISADSAAIVIAYDSATTNWTVIAEFASATAGGIPRANIAPATPNYVVINNGTGFLSEEQYLAKSRGGTAADNSSVTFPSTGTIITRDSTDTGSGRLQNKDLDDDSVKFVDSADTTKTVEVEASGSATGTTTTLASSSTSNRVVTIPDATTTLVGRDTTDTGANRLQNKDLDASSTKFVDPSDTTKTVAVSASGATTGADLVLASVATVDRTLTLPDATDTLIGRVTTDTGANRLQNKELDDATVAFVDDGDTTKKMKFQVSGVTTATTRTLTVPDANTTIVGTDAVQVITEKDIDGGVASNARRITLPKDTYANLLTLTRKEGTILYATDLDQVFYDDGTNLLPVGSGSGQGELNAITNPSAATNTTGWVANGTTTVTRITSGSPLDPIIDTAFELDGGAVNDDIDVDFTLPIGLENKKLKIEWYQSPETGLATGDWEVQMWNQAETVQYALSTDVSGTTQIPALTGKFTTYFDTDATNTLRLKFVRKVGSLYLRVTNVIVGPGIQPQGAVVGNPETIALVPNAAGFGTVSNEQYTSVRVGNRLLVNGRFTMGTAAASAAYISLPSGYNIDTSVLPLGGALRVVGTWYDLRSASLTFGANDTAGPIFVYDSGDTTRVYLTNESTANEFNTKNVNALMSSNDNIAFQFDIPIAEWSGSGTLNLAENAVEYLFNSSTNNGNDTTSFGYGASGAEFISLTGATTTKRIQTISPIQAGDKLEIEITEDGGTSWFALDNSATVIGYANQNGTIYGMGASPVAVNQIDITFGQYRAATGTYGAAGAAWSGIAGDPDIRWRLKKTASNAALGFSEASSNAMGLAGPAGKYTPAISSTTNVSASTIYDLFYIKVGNIVYAQGLIDIDPTLAAVTTIFHLSLPYGSNFTVAEDLSGILTAAGQNIIGQVTADPSSDDALFVYTPGVATNQSLNFNFTYEIK